MSDWTDNDVLGLVKAVNQCELTDEDVVSMHAPDNFAKTPTSTVEEMKAAFRELFKQLHLTQNWVLDQGVNCKILRATDGGGWQKGKIRLRLEFIPDEPKSP